MDHFPTNWGRPRAEGFDAYATYPIHQRPNNGPKQDSFAAGVQHTQQPIVTGTSVLAIQISSVFIHPPGTNVIIGAGGDMSDFQYIQDLIDELTIDEFTSGDGHKLYAPQIHEYLSRVLYARRSKMNPLWNSLLVAGLDQHGRTYVDLLGTTYTASTIATATPPKAVERNEETLTEAEGVKILEDSLRVLFYRDARSLNKFQIAVVTAEGVKIAESRSLDTQWTFAEGIRGYGAQTQ
ncbi:proteasome endopeptidase complex beta subunit [Flagelloscypha sp. PMI_526]|nr:proteasome endopeptidase complex beta subunit [Flagelloscypha sp. PMI_526]